MTAPAILFEGEDNPMPPKRARFISYGSDEQCVETRKFIEDSGVLLSVRDIEKEPMSPYEIDRLLGHFDPRHFLNMASASYEKQGLDQRLPSRRDLIALIAEDHTLLRRPIIQTSRLTTVGCDKKNIGLMLQLDQNGQVVEEREKNHNVRDNNRRSNERRNRPAHAPR